MKMQARVGLFPVTRFFVSRRPQFDNKNWCSIGFNSKDVDGELHYMESADGYVEPLEKAYVYASKTLLELLVGEKDLIGHLRSVKHYFLMDQGDFIVQVRRVFFIVEI